MVSVNPLPAQGFYFFDPMNRMMGLSGVTAAPPPPPSSTNSSSANTAASAPTSAPFPDDPSKKVRKPYTITKSRESWTEQEHDKFLEALQLFDRDWKKIEAFVGSKTVIQIRSHAQKYFLKIQKSGTTEHVPPPRPKRKAVHPYPQKAPRNAPAARSQVNGPYQSPPTLSEPGYAVRPDGVSVLANPSSNASLSSWSYNSSPVANVSQTNIDDAYAVGSGVLGFYNSSNENTPKSSSNAQIINQGDEPNAREMPDFAQVYKFIGSVFDPNASGQLQSLKQMNPINLETALLLMRNLCANLKSPEFEEHRRLLASYNEDPNRAKANDPFSLQQVRKSERAILSA